MTTMKKLFAIGGPLALVAATSQCGSHRTTHHLPDMTVAPPDMSMAPPDLSTLSAPTITNVTPSTAVNNAMTALTMTGTNFRVGALVQVGGVACTQVTVISPTQLTCTYPGNLMSCGGQSLVVTNRDDQTSGTLAAAMGLQLVGLATANFPVGAGIYAVASGDFNGDQKSDLAVANINNSNVSVLLGNGMGGFAAAANFAVGRGPISVAVGDFNGDQHPDFATANFQDNNVSMLLGDGNGGFAAAMNRPVGNLPSSMALGDVNGDGKSDLITTNLNDGTVSVLFECR